MKRVGIGLAALATVALLVALAIPYLSQKSSNQNSGEDIPLAVETDDSPDAQAEMEFMMLRDPRTNAIPRGIRQREVMFARGLPRPVTGTFRNAPGQATTPQALTWTERGPNNVGGRTRVFAIDVANPTTLIAGAVAGGIWKSTDDGASWSLRTAPGQIHSTTCIAQDRRAGRTDTWYVGTGEIRGSTTNNTRWGSLYVGDGIFKSTDAGSSWALLPSTTSGTPQVSDPFDFVINIATNPANAVQDEALAATFKGIYRTTNGGGTWTSVLVSDSGFTDVAVTNSGTMYATTRVGGALNIWRSTNGTTWNAIQTGDPFPTSANRVVIGLAPSNPAVVYFFIQGPNTVPQVAGHQLWRYTYVSGNGSGAGGIWANRTTSLPTDLNTQTGYDQIVHIKPDDENFVIIGGTNLYRSTNAFTTNTATTVIGGYPFYPAGNHHPDLHAGAFSPTDPNIYYSAGDGGLAKAPDIRVASMVWESLNHGYNVTQFYSVAIAPDAGSNLILAGAQDNGSQLGNAPGASDWILAYGGDGTVVEVSPAAENRLYTQYQNGPIQRQNWDGTNVVEIKPTNAVNQMFVNPIVLDPNVTSRLYYAAGLTLTSSMIWRNNNAPVATPATWTSLAVTDVGAGVGYTRRISALGISTANSANVLYYGTVDGMVMKAVNADATTPTVSNVTPPGLNGGTATGGFVRCIAVDPTNSNHALVAFGNYNFQSLWRTTNGGASWTDVEGNLAGPSGPSIRWATLFYVDDQLRVFLGTSIGVLSTSALAGGATVWAQEAASEIGNVIVGYMDYRPSDRTLAVGTHGRGVFTTQIPPVTGVGDEPARERIALGASYPNPTPGHATIPFSLPRAGDVSLQLFDVTGRRVATLIDERREAGHHEARVATQRLATGVYYYVLTAGGATETRTLLVRR